MSADLTKSRNFILGNARLIDRHRFAWRFENGPANAVVAALRPYQNADGGFGHALEPDLRCSASQPVPVEHALHILDEINDFDQPIVERCCDWLAGVATDEGGVPFALASLSDAPHAPWWKPSSSASLNPTAGIVGLLRKHNVDHPWVSTATAYCWKALNGEALGQLGPDDAISVLTFLENETDKARAEAAFERVGARIRAELVALEPNATGYVKSPLDFAPGPTSVGHRLFDLDVLELHLDALAARQQSDGGWPINWEPPSEAAIPEWRAFVTIRWLDVLDNYGRLS